MYKAAVSEAQLSLRSSELLAFSLRGGLKIVGDGLVDLTIQRGHGLRRRHGIAVPSFARV